MAQPRCTNCEENKLEECDVGEELVYRCSGASANERENGTGCGKIVSMKEFREMKKAAEATMKSKPIASSSFTSNSAAAKKPIMGVRKPLAPLHSNSLQNRGAPDGSAPNKAEAMKPLPSSCSSSVVPPVTTAAPASAKKAVPISAPAKPPITISSDSSDDENDDDEKNGSSSSSEESESGEEANPPPAASSSKPANSTAASSPQKPTAATKKRKSSSFEVTSTSTTPTKASPPPSRKKAPAKKKSTKESTVVSASSPTAGGAAFNLADKSISHHARMHALRIKLAAQRERALKEFQLKYGVEGDEETAEDAQQAQRKASGAAGEEFLSQQDGGAAIARAPLSGLLNVIGAENPLAVGHRRPFTAPRSHGSMSTEAQQLIASRAKNNFVQGRRLGARFRGTGVSFSAFKVLEEKKEEEEEDDEPPPPPPPAVLTKQEESALAKSTAAEPLIIWQPTPEELAANPKLTTIEVPMLVCKWLRPHQREGVKFMCECVLGQRNLGGQPPVAVAPAPPAAVPMDTSDGAAVVATAPVPVVPAASPINLGAGAILADDMGLGKTLQSVALVYTLLTQGFEVASPVARKVLIVTPTSLVANWANEIEKWLGKNRINVIALSEVGKDNIEFGLESFVSRGSKAHVLIISYDSFRRHVAKLSRPGLCDLLICDEAHRLKNNKTSTYTTLDSLPCRRRVLLSGTPMQNDLSEFFSMINFTNRSILGDRKLFRKYFELPILMGREPDALEEDAELGSVRSSELSAIVNQFVLRRTNMLLKHHLPPKVIQIVCCRPSELQVKLYRHFLNSKTVKKITHDDEAEEGRASGGVHALPLITSLKKLCNHPKLIWDTCQAAASMDPRSKGSKSVTVLNEDGVPEKVPAALLALFKGIAPLMQQYDGGAFARQPSDARFSGKMFVLERLLQQIRSSNCGDRVVIVSNFTSALDVIAHMCKLKAWDFLRLDGSTGIKKRQQLVDRLGDHRGNRVFVFLLSSRAGGCGLNLIGANRLVLFDPDWNPAVDKQAAARVWRDGQKKRCFIYRFLTTGTIEEKIYQRQLSKEGLSGVLGGSTADASLTKDELRDLFRLEDRALEQPSDTHLSLECDCMDSFEIKTEAEALKAEEAHLKDAEEHAKAVAKQEEDDKRAAEAEKAAAANAMTDVPAEDSNDDDIKIPDDDDPPPVAAAAPLIADNDPEDAAASSSSEDEDAMASFVDDGDGDGEDDGDYDSKKSKKGSAAGKSRSKKDGPRKQRKKRNAVGSLNFPQLHALPHSTRGQRGEPPEEQLINWAHHATSNSIPDPLFRTAAKGLPLTRAQLPYVSFVFSCEISGKDILNSSDAVDALKVSARCEEAPTIVQASKPLTLTLEAALANHGEFLTREAKKNRKRLGLGEGEEEHENRRQSSRIGAGRNTRNHNNTTSGLPNDGDAEMTPGVALETSIEDQLAIQQALDELNATDGKGRRSSKAKPPPSRKKDTPPSPSESESSSSSSGSGDDEKNGEVEGESEGDDENDGNGSSATSFQLPPTKKAKIGMLATTAVSTSASAAPVKMDVVPIVVPSTTGKLATAKSRPKVIVEVHKGEDGEGDASAEAEDESMDSDSSGSDIVVLDHKKPTQSSPPQFKSKRAALASFAGAASASSNSRGKTATAKPPKPTSKLTQRSDVPDADDEFL